MVALLLAGCEGASGPGESSVTPEAATLTGTATLSHPATGSVIYSSLLYAAGTADEDAAGALLLRLVDLDGALIASIPVNAEAGEWSVEWVHGYSGDPTEAVVELASVQAPAAGAYDSREILLSSLEQRPEGITGSISSPPVGAEMGGDLLPVSGRVSGVESFTVELVGSDGTVLDAQTITPPGLYRVNDLPWSVDLAPGDYTGSALIRATFADGIEDTRSIVLTPAAG